MVVIIDGKAQANQLLDGLKPAISSFQKARGLPPHLTAILVGNDPASSVYVRNKEKKCQSLGLGAEVIRLSETVSEVDLLDLIEQLNQSDKTHGILVQLPLPSHIKTQKVLEAIDPKKDVDGFHPINAGCLATGKPRVVPCTALGVLLLLETVTSLESRLAIVIGRSNIVGKPVGQLLLARHATVIMAHSRTNNLPELCQAADIVVSCVGKAGFLKGSWLKKDAVVIDVGINRIEEDGKSRLVGDLDFDSAMEIAAYATPVPGGVGPMTIACLLSNLVTLAQAQVS